jgi:predicted outer membrane protein
MRGARLWWIGVMAFTFGVYGCSNGDRQPTSSERPGARPGAVGAGGAGASLARDDEFVLDVAHKTLALVELSRVAERTTANSAVKPFAQQLMHDHGAAAKMLEDVLPDQLVEWPNQLNERHRGIADEIAQKRGTDADRAYVKAMIDAHQDLAAKLETRLDVQSLADWKTAAAARTRSRAMPEPTSALRDVVVRPDTSNDESTRKINQWAADTYPMVQKHLDTARTLDTPGAVDGVGRQP